MKAKATRTEDIEIEISTHEISTLIRDGDYAEIQTLLHGAKRTWIAKVGYTGDIYINDADGYWYEDWEDGGGSHSWTNSDKKSKATKDEQAIWDHFEVLAKALRAYE